MEFAIRAAAVAVGFGILLAVHEFGHFFAAKLAGVRVERFSLGFGPRLLHFQRGETDYALSLLPFGAYIKLAGESPLEGRKGDPREYWSKPPGLRAFILIAGVAMNLAFGIIAFTTAFGVGVRFQAPEVGLVINGSPAAEAGLRPGDVITKIDDKDVLDFADVSYAVALSEPGVAVNIAFLRNGRPERVEAYPRYEPALGLRAIGIAPAASLKVQGVEVDSIAARAGIRPGDTIRDVNGKEVRSWEEFEELVSRQPREKLELGVARGSSRLVLEVVPGEAKVWDFGLETAAGIHAVAKSRPADKAGISVGDAVVATDGRRLSSWSDLGSRIRGGSGRPIELEVVSADGRARRVTLTAESRNLDRGPKIGITYGPSKVILSVAQDGPAAKAGLRENDTIERLGEREIAGGTDLLEAMAEVPSVPLALAWRRDGQLMSGQISPSLSVNGTIGALEPAIKTHWVRLKFGKAISVGLSQSWAKLRWAVLTIVGLTRRQVSPTRLVGPVGMVQGIFYVAKEGIGRFLHFLGFLSISLAVANLLPIPVLDGGHLMFVLVEKAKGAPLSSRAMQALTYVGLTIILGLFAFLLANDLHRVLVGS